MLSCTSAAHAGNAAEAIATVLPDQSQASRTELQLAQVSPPGAADDPAVTATSIGTVSALQGNASVTRNKTTTALNLQDEIFKDDIVNTASGATLGITFDDETTLNLTANASVVIDDFIFQDGGAANAATFRFVRGTVAFAASAVAKTGHMTMATPTANLGIRGTTGVVVVGEASSAPGSASNDAIKLYPDADGKVGRIEVTGHDGVSLGVLSRGATGLSLGRGPGLRIVAMPLQISPQQVARDQGIVRQVHATQQAARSFVARRSVVRQRSAPRQPNLRQPNPQPGSRLPSRQQPGALPRRPDTVPRSGALGPKPGTPSSGTPSPSTPSLGASGPGASSPGASRPGGMPSRLARPQAQPKPMLRPPPRGATAAPKGKKRF